MSRKKHDEGKNKIPKSQFLVYQAEDGRIKIDVRLENETVWLTQKLMAELFQTSVPNINMHINNIFEEGELATDSVIKEFLTTAADGKQYRTKFYNLDMIILGHRQINSGKTGKAWLGQGNCGDTGKRPAKGVSGDTWVFRPKSMEYAAVLLII